MCAGDREGCHRGNAGRTATSSQTHPERRQQLHSGPNREPQCCRGLLSGRRDGQQTLLRWSQRTCCAAFRSRSVSWSALAEECGVRAWMSMQLMVFLLRRPISNPRQGKNCGPHRVQSGFGSLLSAGVWRVSYLGNTLGGNQLIKGYGRFAAHGLIGPGTRFQLRCMFRSAYLPRTPRPDIAVDVDVDFPSNRTAKILPRPRIRSLGIRLTELS